MPTREVKSNGYRGRLAPTPSGYLHLGHARTFWEAQRRAEQHGGELILRVEDLDPSRSKSDFAAAMLEDLHWFGFRWDEGPDRGGEHGPYRQSERAARYRLALQTLIESGRVYRCYCSRKDVLAASRAPHLSDEGPLYAGTCRANLGPELVGSGGRRPCWRFRVPDNSAIRFSDGRCGETAYWAGRDLGDFVVWRQDDVPSYQLAVTVDDHEMGITEVVRGEDLLISTARQILLYEALEWSIPDFFHCPLVCDAKGERLAKRSESLSLRRLREQGCLPQQLRRDPSWEDGIAGV